MSTTRYTAVAFLVTCVLSSMGGCTPPEGPGFDGIRPDDEIDFGGSVGSGGSGGGPPVECKRGGEACASFSDCCTRTCNADGCSQCAEIDEACDSAMPCCVGNCFNGVCRGDCKAVVEDCRAGSECCSGSCTSGFCDRCGELGDYCSENLSSDCCPGLSCVGLRSGKSCCRVSGHACNVDGDCCGGTGISGAAKVCRDGACCTNTGGDCTDSSECCQGQCVQGRCCGNAGDACSTFPDDCCAPLFCGGTTCTAPG